MTHPSSTPPGGAITPQHGQEKTSLPPEIQAALAGLPPELQENARRQIVAVQIETYSGNLTHPDIVRQWEEICPGAAKTILTMAEQNAAHRHWWERNALRSQLLSGVLGQIFGLAVALGLIIAAGYSASIDHPWVAVAFLAASATGMAKIFIAPRKRAPPASETKPRAGTEEG